MAKLAHLLVLTVLIVWLAGSGCIGNNDKGNEGIAPNEEAGNAVNSEELTQAEVQELDEDMDALVNLLADASSEEEIVLNSTE